MSIFELMGAPFAECLVLVAIHTYLGIHVLKRRVIFVDLALAQIAALGTTIGFLFGIAPESGSALAFSMLFTFAGAALFALTRIRGERVPQEAVIGLVYAIACATAILVVQKSHGAEHLEDILVGGLLWVKWSDVAVTTAFYAVIGAVHLVFRKQFLLISSDPEGAFKRGMAVRAWDFLFYLTFGFVIAISTRVAGVLLVFVFLVAPAIMAFLVTERLRTQLVIGWVMGTAVTVFGLYLSYVLDVPSGPAVIAFYGLALAAGALVVFVVRASSRRRALLSLAAGAAVALLVLLAFYGSGRLLGSGASAHAHGLPESPEAVDAANRDAAAAAAAAEARSLAALQGRLPRLVARCVDETAVAWYAARPDADALLAALDAALAREPALARQGLLLLLADPETPAFYRAEGAALLARFEADDVGYDADAGADGNRGALEALCQRLGAGP